MKKKVRGHREHEQSMGPSSCVDETDRPVSGHAEQKLGGMLPDTCVRKRITCERGAESARSTRARRPQTHVLQVGEGREGRV